MQEMATTPQGIGVLVPAHADAAAVEQGILEQLRLLGGLNCCQLERLPARDGCLISVRLRPEAWAYLCPDYDTLNLRDRLHRLAMPRPGDELTLEIWAALLSAPRRLDFDSWPELQAHVRVRRNIARAAERTALAFNTEAAERPAQFWRDEEDVGFLLRPGVCLTDALMAATQPERTGRLYDFSCYRATEYVILLGIAQELQASRHPLYAQLETSARSRCIKSGLFHEVFLTEYGSMDQPVPMHFYVPGDRVWFRNPDERSSNATGYEGSWVIYLGGGHFSNFWKRDQPYTLHGKCLEIFHWRDGAYGEADAGLRMDENRVEQAVCATLRDQARTREVMSRMHRYRDPSGVYAQGGCIDASREFPKSLGAIRLPEHQPIPL